MHGGTAACVTVKICPLTVMVPTRCAPGFAVAENDTDPLPVPFCALVIVSQSALLLVAVHEQFVPAVTVNDPVVADDVTDWLVGDSENVQAGTAACVTVNVCPSTVIVPTRCAPGLAAAENDTDPLPVPVGALVTVSQSALLLVAVHEQLLPADTLNEPFVAAEVIVWLVGDSEKLHGAAAWDTVNDLPAIVSVVLRAAPVFGLTETATVPLPVPASALVIATHDEFPLAAHEHPAPAVTVTLTVKVPPAAPMFSLVGEMENAHAAAACVIVTTLVPMVSVAMREPPVLAPTMNATVPLPVPDAPLVMTTHVWLADAVHAHWLPVSTDIVPLPPAVGTDCAPGLSVHVHGTGVGGSGGSGGGGVPMGAAA